LDFEAAREAIIRPIERFNAMPANRWSPVTIEDSLVDNVLEQVRATRLVRERGDSTMFERGIRRDSADQRVETPYLQACQLYDVSLSALQIRPGADGTVVVEAQSSYQCGSKTKNVPQAFPLREDFTLRKDGSAGWIIENMTAPPAGRGDPLSSSRAGPRK
jgi:hypothetical protein